MIFGLTNKDLPSLQTRKPNQRARILHEARVMHESIRGEMRKRDGTPAMAVIFTENGSSSPIPYRTCCRAHIVAFHSTIRQLSQQHDAWGVLVVASGTEMPILPGSTPAETQARLEELSEWERKRLPNELLVSMYTPDYMGILARSYKQVGENPNQFYWGEETILDGKSVDSELSPWSTEDYDPFGIH